MRITNSVGNGELKVASEEARQEESEKVRPARPTPQFQISGPKERMNALIDGLMDALLRGDQETLQRDQLGILPPKR